MLEAPRGMMLKHLEPSLSLDTFGWCSYSEDVEGLLLRLQCLVDSTLFLADLPYDKHGDAALTRAATIQCGANFQAQLADIAEVSQHVICLWDAPPH